MNLNDIPESNKYSVNVEAELLHLIMDNNMDAILITIPDGTILSANKAACKMFEMDEAEIIKAGRSGLVDNSDHKLQELLEKRKKEGKVKGELTLIRKSGERFTGEVTSSIFYTGKQEPRTILIIRDISESNKSLRLLKESEKRFQMLFNNVPIGYQSLDINGNFIEINQQWLNVFGYTREEVIGRWFGDFLAPEFAEGFRDWFPVFKSRGHIHSEFEVVHKKGHRVFIAFEGRIAYNIDGDFAQTHGILQDISDRKKMEQEIIHTNQYLEEMIYIASHDLQAPLVSIEGYASELMHNYVDKLDQEGIYCLERLHANSKRMHKLVLSLLDISRLNTVKVENQNVNLGVVVQKIISDFALIIEKKKVKVVVGKLPIIEADGKRIEIALRNIISNAINYKSKKIKISFKNNILAVEDDGIGIPAKQLERIFKPGERLKMVDVEGVGMGLVFCRKVISQHGGKIWAESDGINKGAVFFVEFNPQSIISIQ